MKKADVETEVESVDHYAASASTSTNTPAPMEEPVFKAAFRRFKAKSKLPDLSTIFDPRNVSKQWKPDVRTHPLHRRSLSLEEKELGLKPIDQWSAMTFSDRPGLIILPDVFTPSGQMEWIVRCSKNYPKTPNVTNLDKFLTDDERNILWNMDKLLKVRWVTLGYHYDWDDKVYKESMRSAMPLELQTLSTLIADVLGFKNFKAEAGILNYYQKGSTLSGHVDRSEWNLNPPLLSFSFGHTALYLQGGESLDDPVLPLLLRSGDVMVMDGKQRLVYHGVPRVLPDPINCRLLAPLLHQHPDLDTREVDLIVSFLQHGRINMTIRQMK